MKTALHIVSAISLLVIAIVSCSNEVEVQSDRWDRLPIITVQESPEWRDKFSRGSRSAVLETGPSQITVTASVEGLKYYNLTLDWTYQGMNPKIWEILVEEQTLDEEDGFDWKEIDWFSFYGKIEGKWVSKPLRKGGEYLIWICATVDNTKAKGLTCLKQVHLNLFEAK